MAGTSKKRRAARSPSGSGSGSTKKARQASTTTSLYSQRDSTDPHISRAKSIFRGQRDPYFPHNKQGSAPLPTGDDYLFRVQVISKTSNLHTDVFKKAVQGIVKICFPQDVLEEIGVEVVTQHMRSEDAPAENITMMQDIFRSEMIHRVTWMLAEYLDRPAKVEASVKAIMAASASLHGAKIGEDVLGNVLKSLEALRQEIPDRSTEQFASNTDMETLCFRIAESEMADSSAERLSQSAGPEHDRCPVRSSGEPLETDYRSATDAKRPKMEVVTLDPKDLVEPTREGKEGRVSTSWRWNVEDVAKIENISEHFKRASDLYAYHALPIVKQRLGAQAKRKELRQEIEAMLMNMPAEEFERWGESFEKLKTGDYGMLENVTPDPLSLTNQTVSATPAPGVARASVIELPRRPNQSNQQHAANTIAEETTGTSDVMIKQEMNVENGNAASAPASEPPQWERSRIMSNTSNTLSTQRPSVNNSATPIVDLLWGTHAFNVPYEMVVQIIMESLDRRIPLESFGMPKPDGEIVIKSKTDLSSELSSFKRRHHRNSSPLAIRSKMEAKLVPWIVARLNSFPELKAIPSVFLSIMPDHTHVLDLICDVSMPFHSKDASKIRDLLLGNLRRRGIVGSHTSSVRRTISNDLLPILADNNMVDHVKRRRLEAVLRRIAFSHKSKFRDLKNTALVQAWERSTGLTW